MKNIIIKEVTIGGHTQYTSGGIPDGHTLVRKVVRYYYNDIVHDFGEGPVPAHKHSNGGGWVANTCQITDEVYIGPNVEVSGNIKISGENVTLDGCFRFSGNATLVGVK